MLQLLLCTAKFLTSPPVAEAGYAKPLAPLIEIGTLVIIFILIPILWDILFDTFVRFILSLSESHPYIVVIALKTHFYSKPDSLFNYFVIN